MRTLCRIVLFAASAGSLLMNLSSSPAADSKYPRTNVAVSYEVDPKWPQRPDGIKWDMMPGIAIDKNDHVYVYTRAEPPIQVFDTDGKYLRGFGQGIVKMAHHIKIDPEGNVWAADIGAHQIHKFTPDGKHLLSLGTKDQLGRDSTHFNMPTDVAVTPTGDVFIADGYGNARVVHYDKNGKYVKEWGELGSRPGQFSAVHAIAVDGKGRLFVADRNNSRVQVFDQKGQIIDVWNNLIVPWGLCVTKDDELWVCGSSAMQWRKEDEMLGCPPKDQLFMKFNGDGKVLQLWTVPKGKDGLEQAGELNWVHCIAVDSKGNLYVGDIKGKKAQKFVRREP